jgi:hypothetical protein
MIRQTVFGFKIEKTEETLTAHGGLALLAEYNHGMGLRALADRYLPGPGSNRGYAASAFVDSLVLLLQAGGRRLEDLRELRRESPLLKLVEREDIPDSDTVGDWLKRMGDHKTGQAGLVELGAVRDILTHRLLRRDERSDYTLDVDAVYFRIGVIAYNLFLGFRRLACPEAWGRHTIATFRWKLIQIAGRIVYHAGQIVLKLRVETDLLALIQGIRQRCSEESLAGT